MESPQDNNFAQSKKRARVDMSTSSSSTEIVEDDKQLPLHYVVKGVTITKNWDYVKQALGKDWVARSTVQLKKANQSFNLTSLYIHPGHVSRLQNDAIVSVQINDADTPVVLILIAEEAIHQCADLVYIGDAITYFYKNVQTVNGKLVTKYAVLSTAEIQPDMYAWADKFKKVAFQSADKLNAVAASVFNVLKLGANDPTSFYKFIRLTELRDASRENPSLMGALQATVGLQYDPTDVAKIMVDFKDADRAYLAHILTTAKVPIPRSIPCSTIETQPDTKLSLFEPSQCGPSTIIVTDVNSSVAAWKAFLDGKTKSVLVATNLEFKMFFQRQKHLSQQQKSQVANVPTAVWSTYVELFGKFRAKNPVVTTARLLI